ncbi:MAG: hypothetical protein RL623_75 [Actinomycetota bacterium]
MHPTGLFPATLSILWRITYTTNFGAKGTVGDFTFAASHQMNIREIQALVTN